MVLTFLGARGRVRGPTGGAGMSVGIHVRHSVIWKSRNRRGGRVGGANCNALFIRLPGSSVLILLPPFYNTVSPSSQKPPFWCCVWFYKCTC